MEPPPLFSSLKMRNNIEEQIVEFLSKKCSMVQNEILGETQWKRKVVWYKRSDSEINLPTTIHFHEPPNPNNQKFGTVQKGGELGIYYVGFQKHSAHPFVYKDKTWPTSEHCFQAMKFEGTPIEEQIRNAPNSWKAHSYDWDDVKDRIMEDILRAKFTQNKDILEKLLGTNDAILVYNSNTDDYWGKCTPNGKNKLGLLLMKIRDEIRG